MVYCLNISLVIHFVFLIFILQSAVRSRPSALHGFLQAAGLPPSPPRSASTLYRAPADYRSYYYHNWSTLFLFQKKRIFKNMTLCHLSSVLQSRNLGNLLNRYLSTYRLECYCLTRHVLAVRSLSKCGIIIYMSRTRRPWLVHRFSFGNTWDSADFSC